MTCERCGAPEGYPCKDPMCPKQGQSITRNRCYESMTRVKVGTYMVRVWKTEHSLFPGPDTLIEKTLKTFTDEYVALYKIANALDAFEAIAAYEILDADGNGAIVYPDWK